MKYKYEKSIIHFDDDAIGESFKKWADKNIVLKDSMNALKVRFGETSSFQDCSLNVAEAYKQGWKDCLSLLNNK